MSDRSAERAFTVLELLVVLVVLMLLVAMLFPAFSGRSSPSWIMRCVNNQKQLALAATLYSLDHSDNFPNMDNTVGNDGPTAFSLITKFTGNPTNIFICPAVAKEREKTRRWHQRRFAPQITLAFFASNGNDYAYYDGLIATTNLNAFMGDRFAWTNRSSGLKGLNHPSGLANVAFTDGHVELARSNVCVGTNLTPPWSAVQDPLPLP
jgi:prepilin-type processing-associated H-X9-DG protein